MTHQVGVYGRISTFLCESKGGFVKRLGTKHIITCQCHCDEEKKNQYLYVEHDLAFCPKHSTLLTFVICFWTYWVPYITVSHLLLTNKKLLFGNLNNINLFIPAHACSVMRRLDSPHFFSMGNLVF